MARTKLVPRKAKSPARRRPTGKSWSLVVETGAHSRPRQKKKTRRVRKTRQNYRKKMRGMVRRRRTTGTLDKTLMELMTAFPGRGHSQRFYPKVSTLSSLVSRAPGAKRKVASDL